MSLYKGTQLIAGTRDNRADIDLSNLSTTGEKHFVNKQQISNCILEDPQNIKLELSNGTLTLKAGSVVCVPNGFESDGTTPKFDEVEIESDVICDSSFWNASTSGMIMPNSTGTLIKGVANGRFYSGDTQPTVTIATNVWYDTANNLIKKTIDTGATWTTGWAFPICEATWTYASSVVTITSIDQTFQSIGYMGSTAFVRKGLKVLIPNGLNSDGTLNNIEYTTTNVETYTIPSSANVSYYLSLSNTGTTDYWSQSVFSYNNNLNRIIHNTNGTEYDVCWIATFTATSGVISKFQPYTATNLLKYSDSSTISGWGMPSTRYTDLTLGASGTTYTAPANGWITVIKKATAGGQYLNLYGSNLSAQVYSYTNGNSLALTIPVYKKKNFGVSYSAAGTTTAFRFIYAEGEV